MIRTIGTPLATLAVLAGFGLTAPAGAQQQEAQTDQTDDAVEVIDTTEDLGLDESQKVRIRITNDMVPARSVTVSVTSPTRPEYVLGALLSNETKEWIIDTRPYVGGMRLVATSGSRNVRISRQIDVTSFATVRWGLNTDIVRVERTDGDTDTR